ncbi:hypothetical protein EV146_103202 [Mesobacillus foraminis]|uniref:Uncharacterized protein n=1 Tax=Mesobacillus foraminis TaxID=279826 RepID=A0A4R2BKM1_9BACI|nr:hypothetical protein EV146_103202 [Mesobacillus foraminis]
MYHLLNFLYLFSVAAAFIIIFYYSFIKANPNKRQKY